MDINRLFQINKRDCIGFACWFMVGFAIGIGSIILVGARELYQWKKYNLACFEWEDIIRYTIVILVSVLIRYVTLGIPICGLV